LGDDASALVVLVKMTTRVFVYGSLLSGQRNAHVLGALPRTFGKTRPEWTLVSLGAFPGLIAGGRTAVVGEIVEVDDALLARLDKFEGHPHFYRRQTIRLLSGRADAYVLPARHRDGREVIADGSWPTYLRALAAPEEGE
jgi:gamma-glutamylcyclotransferase (GGCT)/AIG2-like uncharacterized protein YtfP